MNGLMEKTQEAYNSIEDAENILGQKINNPYSLRLAEDAQEAKDIIFILMAKLSTIKDLYGK